MENHPRKQGMRTFDMPQTSPLQLVSLTTGRGSIISLSPYLPGRAAETAQLSFPGDVSVEYT